MSQNSTLAAPVILLIEDDNDIRMAIAEVLRLEGYRVFAADEVDSALIQLRQGVTPQLILLDMNQQRGEARDTPPPPLRMRELSDAPIVVMSADGDLEAKKALAGVVDVLEKPFEIRTLLSVIEQHRHSGDSS